MEQIPLAFVAFEWLTYALFAACLLHAARRGPAYAAELFGGLLFGVLLEWVNVKFLPGYTYGRFLLMLDGIPLCIGAAWAAILYSSMAFTDRLGLTVWTRPMGDALLALNIDLAMDAIAVRLGSGMWVWGWPDPAARWTGDWFGVPFGNFYGWFWVVLLYSLWVRVFRGVRSRRAWGLWWQLLYPLAAVIVSEVLLYFLLSGYRTLYFNGMPSWVLLALCLGTSVALELWRARPQHAPEPSGWVIAAVPLAFHAYFLLALAAVPLPGWTPWLPVASLSMAAAGLAAHFALPPALAARLRVARPRAVP